jgi:hypothetical protein
MALTFVLRRAAVHYTQELYEGLMMSAHAYHYWVHGWEFAVMAA